MGWFANTDFFVELLIEGYGFALWHCYIAIKFCSFVVRIRDDCDVSSAFL